LFFSCLCIFSGPIFENYIASEIKKSLLHNKKNAELFYLRTSHDKEIDIIIDHKTSKEYWEIKHSGTFKHSFLNNIKSLAGENAKGGVIYNGENYKASENLQAINVTDFLLSL